MRLIFILSLGLFLTSCGGESPEKAAEEICDCYSDAMEASKMAENAESTDEMIELSSKMNEAISKGDKCKEEWDEKYNGKVDVEEFKKALKEKDEKVYNMLKERGMFK